MQAKKSALHYAVMGDPPRIEPNMEVLESLLASNHVIDLNAKDEVSTQMARAYCSIVTYDLPQQGNTPLHYASLRGDVSAVHLLVTKGASALEKNNVSNTHTHFPNYHIKRLIFRRAHFRNLYSFHDLFSTVLETKNCT